MRGPGERLLCKLPQRLLKDLHRLPAGDQVALVDDDGGDLVDAVLQIELLALAHLAGVAV